MVDKVYIIFADPLYAKASAQHLPSGAVVAHQVLRQACATAHDLLSASATFS